MCFPHFSTWRHGKDHEYISAEREMVNGQFVLSILAFLVQRAILSCEKRPVFPHTCVKNTIGTLQLCVVLDTLHCCPFSLEPLATK